MAKQFNDTGLCIPVKHYMVNTSNKINEIFEMVEDGKYFSLNRPRQYGKTTTLFLLRNELRKNNNYLVFDISFEGIGDIIFEDESHFCPAFIRLLAANIKNSDSNTYTFLIDNEHKIVTLENLGQFITQLVRHCNKKIVLLIDEVDKSSNNQLFVSFLGMLRNKNLDAAKGDDLTFYSVILAGVHDVKTLKLKINPQSSGKLNSPWNIAADFTVDMSFNATEIATMLADYSQDRKIEMDIPVISERIYYFTSGYPYLVSKLCKIIDERILPEKTSQNWTTDDVDQSFKMITAENYTTTIFDDLTKNFENNPELYELIFNIVFNGLRLTFNINNIVMNLGFVYGIISDKTTTCSIHNRIFEQRIYNYMLAKHLLNNNQGELISSTYYTSDGLNLKAVLERFQQFMKENYSKKDGKFIEREGRLLFLSFLKPIINGKGFDFKEPVTGDERRMDVVITYNNKRYVVELKVWYGEEYHQKGLQQLSDYLDTYSLKQGFLLIYDFRKEKKYSVEPIQFMDKEIFAVWV